MSIIKQNVVLWTSLHLCNQVQTIYEVCPIVVMKNRTAREVQEMYDLDYHFGGESCSKTSLNDAEQYPQETSGI